jgi:hypothetical protein
MPTGAIQGTRVETVTLNGTSVNKTVNAVGEVCQRTKVALPAALTGSLTTRSTNTTGIITTDANHGLAGTERLGVFWTGGRAYQVSITGHTANTITISCAAGDNLPAQDTAVNVSVCQEVTGLSFAGSSLAQLLITSTQPGLVELFSSGPTSRLAVDLLSVNDYYNWPSYSGQSAPFSQTIITADFYNNSTSQATADLQPLVT